MSDGAKHVRDGTDIHELLQLLINILETIRRLPQGPERIAALAQIKDFQSRLSAILLRRADGRIGL